MRIFPTFSWLLPAALFAGALTNIATAQNTPGTSAATSPAAPNTYVLEMSIMRDGELLASPKMTVVHGKAAQMRFTDPKAKEGSLRIQILASPGAVTASGISAVNVQAIIMEQVSGAWLITGEPSILAAEGRPASLVVDGGAGRLDIQVRATPRYDARAESAHLSTCPPLGQDVQARIVKPLSDQYCPQLPCPDDGKKNCCTVPCSDGTGRSMTCCGAIQCCEGICGACCSPEGGGL